MSSGPSHVYCEWLAPPNALGKQANRGSTPKAGSPMSNDRALTPPAVAKRYGINVHRVLAWIRNGTLAAINVGDGPTRPRWRIMPEALEAFERRRASQPPAPKSSPRRRKADPSVIEYF